MTLEALVPVLITLAVLAGILALVYAIVRYNRVQKELAARRAERARELHWEYDDTRDGNIDFRIRGITHGFRWELHYDSDRSSSESSPKVVWRWRERPARRIELAIMGAMPDRIAFGPFGRGIIRFARRLGVKSAAHPDGDDFYQNAVKVESDLTVFQKEWIVRARKPSLFRPVASHEIADLLTRWPEHSYGRSFQPAAVVNLLYDHEGLKLDCGHGVKEMAVLEHIVKIGCAVAARICTLDLEPFAG
jgi:hypothetical protein